MLERLSGFERAAESSRARSLTPTAPTASASPNSTRSSTASDGGARGGDVVCVGPIAYTGQAELQRDIDNFKAALAKVNVTEGFLPVAAPASAIPDRKNEYYQSEEDLVHAIAEAMRTEYKMIVDNGLLVQVDDARAAVTYDRMVPPQDFRATIAIGSRCIWTRSTTRSKASRREDPLSRLLGKLARPAHHRRAAERHRRSHPARQRRRLCHREAPIRVTSMNGKCGRT